MLLLYRAFTIDLAQQLHELHASINSTDIKI